jgi:YebC/PmpR family DNA-binding regulatory protein
LRQYKKSIKMGRAFEFRKARKMKRWANMSKMFTKFGRQISMSVKQGGADLDNNSSLRMIVQNAKGANMPKDRIEAAIKKASSKDDKDYEEVVYEGYAQFGIAILVECATDNPVRTVASVRSYLTRAGGTLGTKGSLDFMFERKGVFKLKAEGLNAEELELELIDFGAEKIEVNEDNELVIYTAFSDFGTMQKCLEERKMEVISAEPQRLPLNTVELTDEQAEAISNLLEKFEEDEDVTSVYHNMKE